MSASPAHSSSSAPSSSTASTSTAFASARKGAPTVAKPINVFSNDGSFLDRFKTSAGEKSKSDEALARKQKADDRFKNRGKRTATKVTEDESNLDEAAKAKKAKLDSSAAAELTAYQKEVAKLTSRSLKDEGSGNRSILK